MFVATVATVGWVEARNPTAFGLNIAAKSQFNVIL